MSDDLISRKAVIKLIDELGYVNCRDQKDYKANSRIDKIRQRIMEMPIVYDVDEVVERLKKKAEYAESKAAEYDEKGNITMMDIWDTKAKSYRNAIEIVKSRGGADE